jgi:hypothetical protein
MSDQCPVCGNMIALFGHELCEWVDRGTRSQLLILDLFAGTGSATQAFLDRGHEVITVEINAKQNPTLVCDVMELDADDLTRRFGTFDFVWASPPCTAFSVASIGHHWQGNARSKTPKTQFAVEAQALVANTLRLMGLLAPNYGWLMENPRGILRKLPVVADYDRSTVTYCQYGETRMKPTDIWGGIGPSRWIPSRSCRNGDSCHESASRGSRTGTQGIVGAEDRSRIPYRLSAEVCDRVELEAFQ